MPAIDYVCPPCYFLFKTVVRRVRHINYVLLPKAADNPHGNGSQVSYMSTHPYRGRGHTTTNYPMSELKPRWYIYIIKNALPYPGNYCYMPAFCFSRLLYERLTALVHELGLPRTTVAAQVLIARTPYLVPRILPPYAIACATLTQSDTPIQRSAPSSGILGSAPALSRGFLFFRYVSFHTTEPP